MNATPNFFDLDSQFNKELAKEFLNIEMMLDAEFDSFTHLGTAEHKAERKKQNEQARQEKETELKYKASRFLESHFFGIEGREAMRRRATKIVFFV